MGSSDGFEEATHRVQGMLVPSQPILDITSDGNDDLRRAILADSVTQLCRAKCVGHLEELFLLPLEGGDAEQEKVHNPA